jgi:hypothetical protein
MERRAAVVWEEAVSSQARSLERTIKRKRMWMMERGKGKRTRTKNEIGTEGGEMHPKGVTVLV